MVAEPVDESVVPQPCAEIAAVEIDGEVVLHEPARGATHHLDAAAAVAWHCLDGQSSLGRIADDVAEVLGVDRGRAVANLAQWVRRFSAAGLLDAPAGTAGRVDAGDAGRSLAATERGLSTVRADRCAHTNRFGWVGSIGVAAGGHLLGVRCNDAAVLAALTEIFAPVRVAVDEPEPNFSVRFALGGRSRSPAHRLQEGCRTLVRSGSLDRVVTALRSFLSAYEFAGSDDRVLLKAVAVVRGEAAVLVPETMRPRLGGAEEQLAARGLAVADAVPALSLDGTAVLVASPALPVDVMAARALAGRVGGPAPGSSQVAVPGRYRLAGWAWPEPSGPLSAAAVVAAVDRTVRNRPAIGAGTALTTVAGAVTGTRAVPLPSGPVGTDAVLDALDALW